MGDHLVIYTVLHTVVPPVAKLIWRPTVRGLDRVPAKGGVLLASNHLSFADSVVIPVVVPRKVVFLAKSDYFTGRGVKGAMSRAWFEGLGMLPGRPRRQQGRAGEPGHGPRGARRR